MDVWEFKTRIKERYDGSLGGLPDLVTEHKPDDEIAYIEHRRVSPQIDRSTHPAPNQDGEYYQGEE